RRSDGVFKEKFDKVDRLSKEWKVALEKTRRLIRAVKFDASDDADDGERRIVRPGAPQDLLAQRVFIRPMPSRKFLIHNDRLQPRPEPVSLIETAQVLFAESGSVVLFGEATAAQQRNPHCAEIIRAGDRNFH